jgi:hypothetical protein
VTTAIRSCSCSSRAISSFQVYNIVPFCRIPFLLLCISPPPHFKATTTMTVPQHPESWQDKVAWAQAKREASLAKVKPKLVGVPEVQSLPQYSRDLPKDVLTSREIELTENYKITELLRLLRERDISVEEVTKAFLRRAALAHAAVRTNIPLSVESCRLISVDQLSHRTSLGSGHRAG